MNRPQERTNTGRTLPNAAAWLRGILMLLALAWGASAWGAQLHLLSVGSIDPAEQTATRTAPGDPPPRIEVIQHRETVTATDRALLANAGFEILAYLPDHAYVVRRPASERRRAEALSPRVRWSGRMEAEWKIAPELGAVSSDAQEVEVLLWQGESAESATEAIAALGATDIRRRTGGAGQPDRITARANEDSIARIAALESVAWIEPLAQIERRLASVPGIVQSDTIGVEPLWAAGLDGSTEILGLIDANIPEDHCFFRDTENPVGPNHRKIHALFDGFAVGDNDSHGAHVAGILTGHIEGADPTSTLAGVAYGARFVHGYDFALDMFSGGTVSLMFMLERARDGGAFIHSNSYGINVITYNVHTRDIDQFTHENEDALVLFAVTNGSQLRSPENAKNVLAVSSTQKVNGANSIAQGGAGPTADGRIKPEIAAPGNAVVSATLSSGCTTSSSSGTSMATPAVAGIAALTRQYFLEGRYPTGLPTVENEMEPSGSLLRAVLLNATRRMTSESPYPGGRQGWGRLVANDALPLDEEAAERLQVVDVRHADGFTDVDQSAEWSVPVGGSDTPLRVTLVWADPEATPSSSNVTINDLDLEVVSPLGTMYRGNSIQSDGFSIPDTAPDGLNTVERVIVANPNVGIWTVRVRSTALPMAPQGYAIAINGELDSTLATQVDNWLIY